MNNKSQYKISSGRTTAGFCLLVMAVALLFVVALLTGQVDIPVSQVYDAITGRDTDAVAEAIVMEARMPMVLTAIFAGAALSVAGLMLQTVFRNPLAGPSLLGVSSGASLGVAIVMMGSSIGVTTGAWSWGTWLITLIGAGAGAGAVIIILLIFSSLVRNGVMLLIIGVLLSYLVSSLISLLNFMSEAEQLKDFTVWGLGSYAGVTLRQVPLFVGLTVALCLLSAVCVKPLNALLLGERYALSMGYSIKRTRCLLLLPPGLLTAVVTAYCGPVGFIGLIVPHLARMIFGSSDHAVILPASALAGAAVSLMCVILSSGTLADIQLPVNVVTPLLGVPAIIYIILRRKSLPYFN